VVLWLGREGATRVIAGHPAAAPMDFTGRGRLPAQAAHTDKLVDAVHRVMTHADQQARIHVRANADTTADARRARRFGARGIGLCRTEHMFLRQRRRRPPRHRAEPDRVSLGQSPRGRAP